MQSADKIMLCEATNFQNITASSLRLPKGGKGVQQIYWFLLFHLRYRISKLEKLLTHEGLQNTPGSLERHAATFRRKLLVSPVTCVRAAGMCGQVRLITLLTSCGTKDGDGMGEMFEVHLNSAAMSRFHSLLASVGAPKGDRRRISASFCL